MRRKRRLYYKDIDGLRFLAFLPVFLYSALHIISIGENEFITELNIAVSYIAQNSLDFFFFLSSFLLTAHALREYKYNKVFGIKSYFIRRLMRILPLFIIALFFAFVVHPWIVKVLKLTPISVPDGTAYLLMAPNYLADFSSDQFIYLVIIWSLYMFLQFYFVWGFIMRIFLQQIKFVGYVMIAIGIAARLYHLLLDQPFTFDTLSLGVPIGIGAIVGHIARKEERTIELIKHSPKSNHVFIYLIGLGTVVTGYLFFYNSYISAFIPIVTCAFFGYFILEQTYGKESLFKMRKLRILTRLGKISYGLIVYHSIIVVIGLITFESLNLNLSSFPNQMAFIIGSFLLSWLVADLSYNYFERPIIAIKKEFKRA